VSEPIRMLDSSPRSPAAALLRAALAETAPRQLPQRIIAGLSTSAAANATAAAAGTSSSLAGTVLATAKWLVMGMAGGVVLAAGASAAFSVRQAPVGHAVTATFTPPPSATTTASVEPSAALDRQSPVEPEHGSAAPVRQPRGVAAVESTDSEGLESGEPPPSRQLAHELVLIRAARDALAVGDAAGALRQLSEYHALAVTGVLDREARVLRIESFAKLGDLARARQLAAAYAREFPRDAYGPRLKPLLQNEGPGGSVGTAGDTNLGRSPTR
jgi:hypothetical protein